MAEFEMSDLGMMHHFLGMMHYFLGIEVMQSSTGIFISQKKYVGEILDRIQMKDCNPVNTPSEFEIHLLVAKRIFQYLQGTKEFGLFYKNGEKSDLFGFTYSDYAGDLDDRKSTFGYVFMMETGVVSWSSKKQPIVTLSSIEAEFVAATTCAFQAIWLKKILKELHFKEKRLTQIYYDNNSTIKLSTKIQFYMVEANI
ncbi:uncharacterized mitochondrial protein AtMg00810-like [Vitis riparia]|uniref:uncharacterized mitochondrial protein AtMg00810-like n=1 Tax=Vitis riparia TaxID=96939 RepID=UPI00155B12F6|nr:uncharacterized mitochondrial protein AtMg00810-like [Vitis riparia]